jgi:hypothetical protein
MKIQDFYIINMIILRNKLNIDLNKFSISFIPISKKKHG